MAYPPDPAARIEGNRFKTCDAGIRITTDDCLMWREWMRTSIINLKNLESDIKAGEYKVALKRSRAIRRHLKGLS